MRPLQMIGAMRPLQRWISATALAGVLGAAIGWWQSNASATPPTGGSGAAAQTAAPAQPAVPASTSAPETAVPADPNKVQIVFSTVPPAHATVTWGRTRLGKISPRGPLVVTRPRDSGPLDVMVRAAGFLPVQTRAQTFSDTKVQVKLTRVDEKSTLLGYRAPLDAGLPLDGGVPTLSDMPPSLTSPSLAPPVGQPITVPPPALQPQPQPQPVQPQPQPQPQVQPKPQP